MKSNWSISGVKPSDTTTELTEEQLEAEIVILLQGTNLFGDEVYSYLKIKGKKLREMFLKMKGGENFKPADFGTVLAAGRGVPTQEVRNEMKAEYNLVDVPPIRMERKQPNLAQPKLFADE